MKILVFLLVTAAALGSGRAQATAYQALQYYTDLKGDGGLNNVFVVRGEGGGPQPAEWILFRGRSNGAFFQATGIKATGLVLTGTAPRGDVGIAPHARPINFSVINLDSNGAYRIAKREARKEDFKFGRIDYELKMNHIGGVPAWNLRLFNEDKFYLGELTLSAATGEVLHPLKLSRYAVQNVDGQPALVTVREPWPRRAVRSVGRWFSQTGTAYGTDLLNAAETTEEILVGRRSRYFADDAR